jgi:hypothetical protein
MHTSIARSVDDHVAIEFVGSIAAADTYLHPARARGAAPEHPFRQMGRFAPDASREMIFEDPEGGRTGAARQEQASLHLRGVRSVGDELDPRGRPVVTNLCLEMKDIDVASTDDPLHLIL